MSMKPGRYYVGDLCYVMHDCWEEVCQTIIDGNTCLNGEFKLSDGRAFASYGTKYGDGTYTDTQGRRYSVDAGLIGCIHVDDIKDTPLQLYMKGGHVVEFEHQFTTGYDEVGGTIIIGHIRIETDTDPVEDEYGDDWY